MIGKQTVSIGQKEWRFIWLIIVLAIVVTSVPYMYGWLTTPPGKQYTGIHVLTPGDINVYFSFIEQARQGNVLFQNLYSPEVKPNILIHPQWNVLGFFAEALHLPTLLVFHSFRILLLAILVVVLYRLISQFFQEPKWRRACLMIMIFATGLGIFFPATDTGHYLAGEFSVDLWVPEAFTFLTIFHNPLFILALVCILIIFTLFQQDQEKPGYRKALLIGLVALGLGFIHPYDLLIIYAVLFVYVIAGAVFNRPVDMPSVQRQVKKYAVIFLVSLSSLIYYYYIYNFIDGYKGWSSQNVTLSPSVWRYLTGYGLIGILSMAGIYLVVKQKQRQFLFIATWLVTLGLLLYFPIQFQRRMSESLHVPMVILATLAIVNIASYLQQIVKKKLAFLVKNALIWLFIIASFATTFFLVARDIVDYQEKRMPFYLTKEQISGFHWLKDNIRQEEVVLSDKQAGNFIPAYSGRKVYYGHGDLSSDAAQRQKNLEWFFDNEQGSPQDRIDFLRLNQIKYIYYQKKEPSDEWLSTLGVLKVFNNSKVTIFKVL